ncbi:MAG: PorT family protein [Hymenobacteraceae bacterium]|nr:PorT family protein [Hymenobacteraceae bacterium]MDX5396552.1 PorT family protein [Hymenobacteraceae bacterium]MDX5443772.1 PorT family protein [Hymenobacteraceae bacterium]MDX5512616.1 PorT family protein [Hymenobacteraceae bacterium]
MIKKILLLSFALAAWSFTAAAQQIRNSIVFGAVASQVDGDNLAGFHKPGLVFGGSSAFLFTDKFSLQPEILYIQKGSKTTNKHDYYLKYRLNYISIPVIAQYKFHEKFTAQGGLSADYLISARKNEGFDFFEPVDEGFKKIDVNAIGAVEYKLSDNFGLNLRYRYSVRGISSIGLYNNLVVISLRYYLQNPS